MHPVSLARSFRRFFQTSPGGYVRQLRAAQAFRDIARSDRDLAIVSAESGFSDQAHLTRTLRAFTGFTPGALRRLFRDRGAHRRLNGA